MMFHPAAPDTGIVFRRSDRGGAPLRANWRRVRESALCTTIDDGEGLSVATIEHVMAALAGLEIDNAIIELDGPEVPVMDGSAAPFVFLLECAGIVEQDAPRRAIEVLKPVSVGDGGKSAALTAGRRLRHQPDHRFRRAARSSARRCTGRSIPKLQERHRAAPAPSAFCEDVEALRAAGLARGGSMDNAIVIGEGRVLNRDGLRFPRRIRAPQGARRAGRSLSRRRADYRRISPACAPATRVNRRLLEALFADRSAYRIVARCRPPRLRSSIGRTASAAPALDWPTGEFPVWPPGSAIRAPARTWNKSGF